MASTNSWDGEAQLAHYNASKSGVFLLAKTLARELGKFGINSNAVGPGPIRTRLSESIFNDPIYQAKYHPETGVAPPVAHGNTGGCGGPRSLPRFRRCSLRLGCFAVCRRRTVGLTIALS